MDAEIGRNEKDPVSGALLVDRPTPPEGRDRESIRPLRLHGRRLDAKNARGPVREPPVPAAEDRNGRGREDAADDRRVDQDSTAEREGEDLGFGARLGAERDEREPEDQRGARDEPAGAADALDDGGLRRAGAVVCLPHPADDEDLVVHRDAEEEGEDDDRHLDVDRLCRLDAEDLVGPEALLEDEHDQPPRRSNREQVQEDGLQRQEQRAERAREEDEGEDGDQREHEREVGVDGFEEVGALRCLATDRHLGRQRLGAEAVERLSAGRGVPVLGRDDRDERRPVAAPVRGRRRTLDTVDLGERCRDGLGIA